MTSWTDDRTDLAKKLWSAGFSAGQIAAELGGVTRNAVIGKIHRLGLSGRRTATAISGKRRAAILAAPRPKPKQQARTKTRKKDPGLEMKTEDSAPEPLKLALTELTEQTCKWPIRDPLHDPDFHFCGNPSVPESPYCDYHFRQAYQPNSTWQELQREAAKRRRLKLEAAE